jgi:hypothetical protein
VDVGFTGLNYRFGVDVEVLMADDVAQALIRRHA